MCSRRISRLDCEVSNTGAYQRFVSPPSGDLTDCALAPATTHRLRAGGAARAARRAPGKPVEGARVRLAPRGDGSPRGGGQGALRRGREDRRPLDAGPFGDKGGVAGRRSAAWEPRVLPGPSYRRYDDQ